MVLSNCCGSFGVVQRATLRKLEDFRVPPCDRLEQLDAIEPLKAS